MRTFTCYDCEAQFQARDRDAVLQQLYTHYMSEHHDIITGASQAEKQAWMERFEKDWNGAPES